MGRIARARWRKLVSVGAHARRHANLRPTSSSRSTACASPAAAATGAWTTPASASPATTSSRISACTATPTSTSSATGSARTPSKSFFDLADEYGLMVWNDFWESTQNYNVEAAGSRAVSRQCARHDPPLPQSSSIVVWCGRNEGVPQPIINEGLVELSPHRSTARATTPPAPTRSICKTAAPTRYMDPTLYLHHAESRLLRRNRNAVILDAGVFPRLDSEGRSVADQR